MAIAALTTVSATTCIFTLETRAGAASSPTLDQTVSADVSGGAQTVTSPALSTSASNELLLAFVAFDGGSGVVQSISAVSGGGLAWTRVVAANAQPGTAEVWEAYASSPLSGARITATTSGPDSEGSLTVAAFANAQSAVGATGSASASTGAEAVSLKTSAAGSWIWGVGNDWSQGVARTPASGQTLQHQYMDSNLGNTYWVQQINAVSTSAGQTETVSDSAPSTDIFNMAAVEILPATSGTGIVTTSSLWPSSATPAVASASDSHSVEIGTRFEPTTNGYVTGVRFYKGKGNTGTHVGSLWSNSGVLLASGKFTSETATGWQQMTFSKPVPVSAGTLYVVGYLAPAGHYSYNYGYFSNNSVTAPGLYAPADGSGGYANGAYALSSSSVFPTNTYKSMNYWVDVTFQSDSNSSTATTVPPTTTTTVASTTTTTAAPTTTTTLAPSTTTTTTPTSGSGQLFSSYYTKWSNGPDPTGNPSYFPIGVWEPNDGVYATDYQALGITVAIQEQGTLNWNSYFSGPPGGGQFGLDSPYSYLNGSSQNWSNYLTDEPDMNQVNYGTNNELTAPSFSTIAGNVKAADPTRPTYSNFGKCFSEPNWVGCQTGIQSPSASSVGSMDAQYCQNVDVVSADYYGYTDPYDALSNGVQKYYGAWTYGQDVANVHAICGASKPVLNFVETGEPFSNSTNTITPSEVTAATWDGIMHGANGIIYFDHDFSGVQSDNGMVNGGPQSTTVAPVVSANDSEILALAPWLNSPSQTGVSVSATNGIPVTTMLKTYNGHSYLFAMADGNASHLNSGNTTATISVPGTFGSSAVVYNESRSVTVTNGNTITDSFGPYQVHIYQLS